MALKRHRGLAAHGKIADDPQRLEEADKGIGDALLLPRTCPVRGRVNWPVIGAGIDKDWVANFVVRTHHQPFRSPVARTVARQVISLRAYRIANLGVRERIASHEGNAAIPEAYLVERVAAPKGSEALSGSCDQKLVLTSWSVPSNAPTLSCKCVAQSSGEATAIP